MSWSAHRRATREEDTAYSLLELFNIHMPLLYGEGRSKAFLRLQEEVFNRGCDHSLFLFTYCLPNKYAPLIADNPSMFCQVSDCNICPEKRLECFPRDTPYESLRILGTITRMEVISVQTGIQATLKMLNEQSHGDIEDTLSVLLNIRDAKNNFYLLSLVRLNHVTFARLPGHHKITSKEVGISRE
jgi:hypothetical protein